VAKIVMCKAGWTVL